MTRDENFEGQSSFDEIRESIYMRPLTLHYLGNFFIYELHVFLPPLL